MLDRYVSGSVSRISPEAPVPVVHVTREEGRPGGAANVALNIQELGGQAIVSGVVGDDAAGQELMDLMKRRGIRTDCVLVQPGIPTTVKTRILAERQQVVRVDHEWSRPYPTDSIKELCRRVTEWCGKVDGVIIEDYGKGAVPQELVDCILSVRKQSRIPVALDPNEFHDLQVSGITFATPNYREARAAAGLAPAALSSDPAHDAGLAEAAGILRRKWDPDLLAVTLGPAGMYLDSRRSPPVVIPTRAREVFDVCGAGDTVIGTAMMAVVAGANYLEAATLANYAAGVVVGKVGTATCDPDELLSALAADAVRESGPGGPLG
jgi:D-beta-D-heptose 7-phosphate kinase/D-beta-D-heptose 1-phosphate adenosyltransferase